MDEITYSNILEFIKGIFFSHQISDEQKPGELFLTDEYSNMFIKIIRNKLRKPGKPVVLLNEKEEEIRINIEKRMTGRLSGIQKFTLFTLIYQACIDPKTGKILPELINQTKRLSKVLDINKKELSSISDFFLTLQPFTDNEDSIYYVSQKKDQLIRANGINIHFKLKTNEEIYYLKYIKKQNVFLCKTFCCHRPNNSITENIIVKEFNLINTNNYYKIGLGLLSFEELTDSLKNHFPFQSVKTKSTENTPAINLDTVLSKITISGSSSPLSPINYFQPIYGWLKNYELYGADHLEIHLQFDYFNSYTSKFLWNLINSCKALSEKGKEIELNWHYNEDDEEMFDFGKHLKTVFNENFKLNLIVAKTEIPA